MRLPDDLPQQAKARIYQAKIEAERALEKGKKEMLPDTIGIGGRQEAIDALVRTFFLHVLAQFTHEACQTSWSVERIDKEVTAFVETFLSDTVMEYTSPTFTFPNVISRLNGKVLPEIWEGFRASKTWRKYQDELEQVAARQAHDPERGRLAVISRDWNYPIAGEQPSVERKRREPRPELLANPEATLSRLKASEALGITPRTLDRWIKDGKLTTTGLGAQKRLRTKDLKRLLDQKLLDSRDTK
jgi:hypothetical protein